MPLRPEVASAALEKQRNGENGREGVNQRTGGFQGLWIWTIRLIVWIVFNVLYFGCPGRHPPHEFQDAGR